MKRNSIFKTFALLAMLLTSSVAMAQAEGGEEPAAEETTTVQCLVITANDGSEYTWLLRDAPVLAVSEGNLTVNGSDLVITLADVQNYVVTEKEEPVTAIDEVSIRPDGSKPSLMGGKISGLQPGSAVNIYSLNGQLKGVIRADQNGDASIDLGTLQRGQVYILSTPAASFKILNR